MCPHHHGPRSECAEPDAPRYPQRSVCYFEMERQGVEAAYRRKHKVRPFHDGTFNRWAAEQDEDHPYHAMDGVTFYVAPVDVHPDDDFLADPDDVMPPDLESEASEEV